MIYFISNGTYTKIGKADNPEKRIKELQTGCPETLEIKLVIDGDEEKEKMLHKALNKYRIRGEWFKIDFEYNENIIKEIIYFHNKLNKAKKPKRITSKSIIYTCISNLKNENEFITIDLISKKSGVPKKTIGNIYNLFKTEIDRYNVNMFNTSVYAEFIKISNVAKISSSIIKFKDELEIRLTKKKVAKKSELHINTVYNLWLEDDVQEALEEYNKWVKQLKNK
jgi:hypothetical protein